MDDAQLLRALFPDICRLNAQIRLRHLFASLFAFLAMLVAGMFAFIMCRKHAHLRRVGCCQPHESLVLGVGQSVRTSGEGAGRPSPVFLVLPGLVATVLAIGYLTLIVSTHGLIVACRNL